MIPAYKIIETNDLVGEVWLPSVWAENNLLISNLGRVKTKIRHYQCGRNNSKRIVKEGIRKQSLDSNGYPHISIWVNGSIKTRKTHILVAQCFIANPDNKPQVNHKNGIKTDNRVENLEWATVRENQIHAYNTGLKMPKSGTNSGMAKLSEKQVIDIFKSNDSPAFLSKKYSVTPENISAIKRRVTWKHITNGLVNGAKQNLLSQSNLF